MKKLAWLSVEDYATTQMELMVVSAMKGYLRRMPVQSNVDGAKLAAFIDAAVRRIASKNWRRETMICQKLV